MPITDAWIGDSVQETLAAATEGTAAADGTQVATFTSDNTSDPANAYVATIDWGDGTTTTGTLTGSNGAFTVLGPVGGHIYADEGNETVSVTVTRPADGTVSTGAGTVAVAEGDVLTAQPSTFTATSNIAFNGAVATFTDTDLINLPGDFAATINWGDATTTVGTVTGSNGLFTVSGTHTYMAAGTDVVTVTLTDDAPAATATANSTANVGTVLTVQETLAAATAGTAAADGTPIVGLPADRLYDWNPGLDSVGGIPDRTTVFTTVNPGGDIQAAIDACPPGEVVQLAAGTFTVNNYLLIDKGITLRGAVDPVTNAPLTFLHKTNGATPGSYTAPDYQPIIVVGPNLFTQGYNTSTNLTSDAVAGTSSITLASTAGLSPGQFVLLDENDYTSASFIPLPNRNGSPTSAEILASDRVVFMDHQPSDPGDDPFPASLTWFSRSGRPLNEIKEIASISGNTVTFTSPITIDYTVSKTAQLTSYADTFVQDAGIENLSVNGGSDGNVRFEDTAYSWMKNVEDTNWLGEGVAIDNSFRDEVEGSYIHDGAWSAPGGGGYAISLAWGSAEALIDNNIILHANKMMVGRSAGAGTVVAYNYADDGFINYDPSWQEVGINGSHMVGSHSWLFEGNESFNYDSDNTHGNAIYMTVFRNDLTGDRTDFPNPEGNARAVGLMFGSWWQTIIGNVLGTPGMTGWTYQSPGLGNQWGNDNIWEIGYDPQHWEQDADPKTVSTLIRGGNYDYVTNSVHWENIPSQALPPSLYLSSKPAFFGSYTWPWVDPTGSTQLYILPAKARYDAGTPFLLPSSPPVLTISALVGQPVNGSAIEVKGTGVAGDTVMLYVDGGTTPVGTGTVAADGSFDISTSTTFADGSHTLVATQADAMGVTSTTSNSFAVAVDPSAPTILSLVDQVNGSVAQVTDVKGTGEAGDTVTLYADGGTTPLLTGTVAADGSFDITTNVTFAGGSHTLTATQTDAQGLTSPASANFAVPFGPSAPVITTLVGQPVTGSAIEVKGTGEAGDTVTLYADGNTTPVATGTVAANGNFDITTSVAFVYGSHTLTATQTDAAGLTSQPSAGFAVAVNPTTPPSIVPPIHANDLSYSSTSSGPNHFIDLLNFEAGYPDLVAAFGTNQAAMQNWYSTREPIENRPETFDGLDYIASFRDLISAFGAAGSMKAVQDTGASHYITNGEKEGRTTTFNGLDYIASYSDLIKAFGANNDAGAFHYIENGHNEGRTTSFDGLDYIASYVDLMKAFGANEQAGAAHFIDYGHNEGRTTTFDGLAYIAQYTDLMQAFGANNDAGAAHYINNGFSEGRSTAFNVGAYESAHQDLSGKFASNDAFLTTYIGTYNATGKFLI